MIANGGMTATISDALHRHLHWQQQLYRRISNGDIPHEPPKFLVLRPGDRMTLCTTSYLASGKCFSAHSKFKKHPPLTPHDPHWDDILTNGSSAGSMRNLPGLGNIAASLASSAVVAMLSRRVLLCENWTVASESFAAPLSGLGGVLLGHSGWEPHLARAQSDSRWETFITHDDTSLASVLCGDNMRLASTARVRRRDASHNFTPLLPPRFTQCTGIARAVPPPYIHTYIRTMHSPPR